LEHGVHQHMLGTEMKAAAIGGLKLWLDENIRLENRQAYRPLGPHAAQALDPERRLALLFDLAHLHAS
jgi:hypothetical protein